MSERRTPTSRKQIELNHCHMSTPSQSWSGMWTHPDDNSGKTVLAVANVDKLDADSEAAEIPLAAQSHLSNAYHPAAGSLNAVLCLGNHS